MTYTLSRAVNQKEQLKHVDIVHSEDPKAARNEKKETIERKP